MLQEIQIFFKTILDWLLLLAIFTVFFFSFNVETVSLFGRAVLLPVPSDPSFAAEFFTMLVRDIAPAGIPLVVTSPMAAFIVQVKLAFLLAAVFTFPVFLYRLLAYLAPALYTHELRLIYRIIVPISLLFFAGVYFAYATVAPVTLQILYGFAESIGVISLLGVTEFVGVVTALALTTGAAFTLPVFMVFATALGVVGASFWFRNARYALVSFLVVSAIITPDGSGVSMMLLALPVSGLYGLGALVCHRIERAGRGSRSEAAEVSN